MIQKIKTFISELSRKILNFARDFFRMDNLALIAIVVLALIWSFGSIGVLNQNYALQRQVDQANLDNQIISLQNQNLRLEQNYYKTDEFLGLQARALLGKANPGENLVLLSQTAGNSPKPATASSSSAENSASGSNLSQWEEFLFGAKN